MDRTFRMAFIGAGGIAVQQALILKKLPGVDVVAGADISEKSLARFVGTVGQMRTFTDDLKRLCRGMNIDYQRFSSGDPLDVPLSTFLANRAGSMK